MLKNDPCKDFIDKLQQDPVKLKKFLRDVMGPPKRTLEGKERGQVLLLLALTKPFNATNNQHSFTEYYMIGKTEYHVTTFPGEEATVDQMLPEDEE